MEGFEFKVSETNKREVKKEWDLIIIGAGPGGLSSALYASRALLDVLVIEKNLLPGGQIGTTSLVEDYPGIESISGEDLGKAMMEHAKKYGAVFLMGEEVVGVDLENKVVNTNKSSYKAKAIIIATGAKERHLNVKGEKELKGRGVSYCAVCDAPFFKDKEVIVVGGGNSALDESLYISKFAKKVIIVHRRDKFRGDKILQERVFSNPKIEIMWNTEVREIIGKDKVEKVRLINNKTGEEFEKPIDGIFIYIGMIPNSELFNVDKDERGYIITNDRMETNIEGVYAVGDVRKSPVKQAVTAAAEGAIAALVAEKYIEEIKEKQKNH